MLLQNFSGFNLECGVDEAGRGCLAGPVTAAAVILPKKFKNYKVKDSKKLNWKSRKELANFIKKNCLAYSIKNINSKKIDEINILNSSILAMHKCLDKIDIKPEFIIVDGNKFKAYKDIPHKTIIKGDDKYLSIAAASILAKDFRDDFMIKLDKKYPNYLWKKNKGYPTKSHREAIKKIGITKFHRKTFSLYDKQLKMDI